MRSLTCGNHKAKSLRTLEVPTEGATGIIYSGSVRFVTSAERDPVTKLKSYDVAAFEFYGLDAIPDTPNWV